MPTIDVRDTRLYYEMAGEGDVPLLFIHGMCGGAWSWEEQMKRLSPYFTCVAYDRRGHSRSEPGDEDQSFRTHVDDAAALIDALGLDLPILVGTSAGGAIAIEVLHRYPERVRGAVVSEPVLFSLNPGSIQVLKKEIGPAIQAAVANDGPRTGVDAFFQKICTQFWSQIDEAKRDRLRDNAPMMYAALESQGTTITVDDLPSINQPVLVVTGSNSLPLLLSLSRTLVEHLPNARLIEFDDCGHVTHGEKPDEFAQAVTAFVHEIEGSVTASPRV